MTDPEAELRVESVEAAVALLGKPVVAGKVPSDEPSDAVIAPLTEPSDPSTGSTVATVDWLAEAELIMRLDSYAESEARSEATADPSAAVVSEPEEIRVEFPSPSVLVVCDRMSVGVAEVAGAVPATPGKVIPEAMLVGIAEVAVFSTEAYDDNNVSSELWSTEVSEGVVIAPVPIAPDRDIPSDSVVAGADEIVFWADESNEGVESAADCMPVDTVVSGDVFVDTAESAVPGPE